MVALPQAWRCPKHGASPFCVRVPSNLQVDGAPVRRVEDLLSAVEERQVGEAVTLRVLRGCDPQREETLKVRLGSAR